MRLGKYLSGLTKPELEVFKNLCNFTEEEDDVFRFLYAGKQVSDISIRLNISEATVNRRIKTIRAKIERIEKIGKDTDLGKNEFVN